MAQKSNVPQIVHNFEDRKKQLKKDVGLLGDSIKLVDKLNPRAGNGYTMKAYRGEIPGLKRSVRQLANTDLAEMEKLEKYIKDFALKMRMHLGDAQKIVAKRKDNIPGKSGKKVLKKITSHYNELGRVLVRYHRGVDSRTGAKSIPGKDGPSR